MLETLVFQDWCLREDAAVVSSACRQDHKDRESAIPSIRLRASREITSAVLGEMCATVQ